jgi:integrase/recombinase XerD
MSGISTIRLVGPLALQAEGFCAALVREGYSPRTARDHVYVLAHLSRWLSGEGLDAADVGRQAVERFLLARRAAGYRRWLTVGSLRPLLGYLRGVGAVPAEEEPVLECPVERLVAEYRRYLVVERGLAPATVRSHGDVACRFLSTRAACGGLDLSPLTPREVAEFVVAQSSRYSPGSMRVIATALRSLLRFLFVTGAVGRDLRAAVPTVANRAAGGLPKAVEAPVVAALLNSCDRSTAVGLRDFAVLTVLARLGLRAGEVAALRLDDIDWRAGELVVRGKGNRVDRMPLPQDVGAAVADYLRRGRRPGSGCRALFLRACGPDVPMSARSVVMVPRSASRRAGVAIVAAHQLRHTAATETLRRGAPLPEVAQLLRHRSEAATALYATVDRVSLDLVVRPWPGAER